MNTPVSDERLAELLEQPAIFAGDEPDIYALLTELQSRRAAHPAADVLEAAARIIAVDEGAPCADDEIEYLDAIKCARALTPKGTP